MGPNQELLVRYSYERFSDYFIASKMIGGFTSLSKLRETWTSTGLLEKWDTDYTVRANSRGIKRMMAILLPERFQFEFIDLYQDTEFIDLSLLEDFVYSLYWRTPETINQRTEELLLEYQKKFGIEE